MSPFHHHYLLVIPPFHCSNDTRARHTSQCPLPEHSEVRQQHYSHIQKLRMLRRQVLEKNTAKNNKTGNTTANTMGDIAVMEQIQREDVAHYAAMRRRAEIQSQDLENRQATQNQEFEHRRLMLGLDRFHELELSRMRRHNAIQIKAVEMGTKEESGGINVEGGLPTRTELGELMPGAKLFRQVPGDGVDDAEPLFLRVEWVDSDCGGFFKWENQAPTPAARDGEGKSNGVHKVDRKGKMRERRDDLEMDC